MASAVARLVALAALLVAGLARAEKQPANAHLIDVTRADVGVVPNDGLDDYANLKHAMGHYDGATNGNVIYFPCGTYNFSDTIEWRAWSGTKIGTPPNDNYPWTVSMPIRGEDRDCVVLKLDDNAPGFQDPNNPKPFIKMATLGGPSSNQRTLNADPGAGGYRNNIEDMTIDCGSGNPGARCIDWIASNAGEIHRVRVRSGDGSGSVGIAMVRGWPGPCLIFDTIVDGFDTGIDLRQVQYGVTFLKVTLNNQNVQGFRLESNLASIEKLETHESADIPSLVMTNASAVLAMINSSLNGPGTGTHAAVELLTGTLSNYWIRNLTTTGYPAAITKGGVVSDAGPDVQQSVSTIYKLYNSPDISLDLPAEYPPDPYWVSPDTHPELWANVLDYGAGSGLSGEANDDTTGIQNAFNSGKPIVYFPKNPSRASNPFEGSDGIYALTKAGGMTIPSTVRRIFFNNNSFILKKAQYSQEGQCVFTILGTADDPPLEVSEFRRTGDLIWPAKHFCNAGGRTFVARSFPSPAFFESHAPNKTFLLDLLTWSKFSGGAKLFTWQRDPERFGLTPVDRSAGLFVDGAGTEAREIGIKSEGDFTMTDVTGGAKYQLVGGFLFPCIGNSGVLSDGFHIVNSQASIGGVVQYCGKNPAAQSNGYVNAAVQTVGDTVRSLSSLNTKNQMNCCSYRNYMALFNAKPSDFMVVPEQLTSNPPSIYFPFGLSTNSFRVVQIDRTGVDGVNMDPGQWTGAANCSGMSHLNAHLQHTGVDAVDVDLYSCLQIPGGPVVGFFDPKDSTVPKAQKSCVNLTRDVEFNGETPHDVFEFEGSVGQIVARLTRCDGDCAALLTLQCTR
jgi:hypothetical protein